MTTRHYRITHVTTYRYHGGEVTTSHGTYHLRPRTLAWQPVHDHQVTLSPPAERVSVRRDVYGNQVSNFQVTEPHRELVITARTDCSVADRPLPPELAGTPWEQARPGAGGGGPKAWRAYDFVLASPRIDVVDESYAYAAESFTKGRPVAEALLDLNSRIHADFAYRSGTTTVTTSVPDVFAARQGVCQDFAQVMISCLRSQGLAARYVSGYLATRPPPGKPRLVGADASHAWVAVWIPGREGRAGRWWHLDPTNDRACDESHATVAWGRDYGDVAPVRGVIYATSTSSTMDVSVDMAPLADAPG
ncbi:transglutaminase family protein [Propionibacteriaceae bacterium Y2011]|uniref:transglutaminase family protein n=1 Tax=Microlunatus sp. Y2014 TaxID=3418488 RepID=UPI003B47B267